VFINGSQFPNLWLMSVADNAILWERQQGDYRMTSSQNYYNFICPCAASTNCNCANPPMGGGAVQNPEGWYFAFATAQKAQHVVFSVTPGSGPSGGSVVSDIVCRGQGYGPPGLLYIHDSDSNHYDHASPYLSDLYNSLRLQNMCNNPDTIPCGYEPYDNCGIDCGIGRYYCPPGLVCPIDPTYGCQPQ
jgi:hypothetical protein